MLKATRLAWVGLILLLAGCQNQEAELSPQTLQPTDLSLKQEIVALDDRKPMSLMEMERIFYERFNEKGELSWSDFDAYTSWSALVRSDSMISVGYQPQGFANLNERIHQIDFQSPQWQQVRKDLIQWVVDETNRLHP